MKKTTTLLLLLISITSFSQKIKGNELLEKAIQFHDPKGNWETFKGEFFVTMETPKNASRKSTIKINLPEEYFLVKAIRDTIVTEYIIQKDDCSMSINGNINPSEELKNRYNLNCERANMYKNWASRFYCSTP